MSEHELADDLNFALRLADAAREISLARFRGSFEVRVKPDGSLVTEVDEAVEDELRSILASERPGDAILGEERGPSGRGERRWLIDAIDGTHSFAAGAPHWGTLIALEDFKLVPGDLVSMYAKARDARTEQASDIMFLEAQPFEREYEQSQQAGGGGMGGGMGEQDNVSQRQKEIIAATFNQIRDKSKDAGREAENAKFLSDMQAKLRDQHGQAHYVLVEPDNAGEELEPGSEVVIVRQASAVYYAIKNTSAALGMRSRS